MKEADSLIKRAMKYLKSARLLLDTLADLTAAINKELAANPLRTIFNHCKQVIFSKYRKETRHIPTIPAGQITGLN